MRTTLEMEMPPSVNAMYKRTRRGTVRLSDDGRKYKRMVKNYVLGHRIPRLEGELSAMVEFHPRKGRTFDIDNRFKTLFDSIEEAGVFENDSQIKLLVAIVHPKTDDPRVVITLEEVEMKEWFKKIYSKVVGWFRGLVQSEDCAKKEVEDEIVKPMGGGGGRKPF